MACVFCKIAAGDIPSDKIYEDENFLAFLDISPVNPGHTLVIPKKHYENYLATPDELIAGLFQVVAKVGRAVKAGVKADGINIGINNGAAAGQVIFHTHAHVIPRFSADGYKLWGSKEYKSDEEKLAVAEKIRESL